MSQTSQRPKELQTIRDFKTETYVTWGKQFMLSGPQCSSYEEGHGDLDLRLSGALNGIISVKLLTDRCSLGAK